MDAFDLNRFAPPAFITFRLRKHGDREFRVDGDPDTGDVALMLRIEEKMRSSENAEQATVAAEEGKELLLRLIREQQPDVDDVKIGMQEVLVLFALIVHGSSVAAAVAEAITAPDIAASGAADPVDETAREEGEPGPQAAEVTPLPSAARSSEASSSLESRTVGLPATGTG